MNLWPFVSRRRHQAELDAVNADRERLRGERNQFAEDRDGFKYTAETAARRFVEADAANRRLHNRNLELGRRLSALSESDPEYAAALEQRIASLTKASVRVLGAWHREQTRADRLQARLDDAVGLGAGRPLDSTPWQPGYVAPKPDPKPEATS